MKKLSIIVLVFGVVGLASGCEYYTVAPAEIVSRGIDSTTGRDTDSEIVPSGEGTRRSEGAVADDSSTEGDETILPSEPLRPAPRVEGDGVADETPEVGRAPEAPAPGGVLGDPPLPAPVSCNEPAFAFVSKREGFFNIYRQTPEGGSAPSRITDLRGPVLEDLTVHPTENILAVTSQALFLPATMAIDLDAATPVLRPLFDTDADGDIDVLTHMAAYRPDGREMAYVKIHMVDGRLLNEIFLKNEDRVFVASRDGSRQFHGLAWLDTKLIYSMSTRGEAPQIWIRDTVRGDDHAIPDMTDAITNVVGTSPTVSRDGRLMAFAKKDSYGTDQIHICRLDEMTEGLRGSYTACRTSGSLTRGSVNNQPSFSPDGRWIYFVSDRDGNKEIYRIRPDGTGEERLTNNTNDDTSPAPFEPYASCH